MAQGFNQDQQDHHKEAVRKISNRAWNKCNCQDVNYLVSYNTLFYIRDQAIPVSTENLNSILSRWHN